MSVDQQIREGLVMLDQQLPTPDTFTAYEVIVHDARARSRRTRFVQLGLVAAAAAVVVATSQITDTGLDLTPLPAPAPAPAPVDEPSISAPPVAGLDGWEDVTGHWTTDEVSTASIGDALRKQGVDIPVEELGEVLPDEFDDGVVLGLELHLGRANLSYDGEALDPQNYSVDEDATFFLRPLTAPGGRSRFSARLENDQLSLAFLDTTVPTKQGVPEELWLRALYTTVPFDRVPE